MNRRVALMRWSCLLLAHGLLIAAEVRLRAPLTTTVEAVSTVSGDRVLTAAVEIGDDAPADLGVAAYVRDREGRWFQSRELRRLTPGRHHLRFTLSSDARLHAEPSMATSLTADLAASERTGLVMWSRVKSDTKIVIHDLEVAALPSAPSGAPRLVDLRLDGCSDGIVRGRTGERWVARVLPSPLPRNPFDPGEFSLDAVVTDPSGIERRIGACWCVPMRGRDRGDREEVVRHGDGAFEVRLRPSLPGRHRLRLEASWRGGEPMRMDLPDLVVDGPAIDRIVRVDRGDPRFFSIDGAFWWPIGINLHSTYDLRSKEVLQTRVTPARGSLVYEQMFPRLAAVGIDVCEIWMSAWNLALEWRGDWPGFHGLGRYSQENAWRLDRVLDLAWQHGIRVNLVINNHGQASPKTDRQWKDNPLNQAMGGSLANPADVFTDAVAFAYQDRLRRYLVARYADHPAILGWKLWSEVNLTAGRGAPLTRWHEQAAARWHALDTYGHPVTTHWSGDYRGVSREICALPGIDYICINSYRRERLGVWSPLAGQLVDTLTEPRQGLQVFAKPVLVTEYGAGSSHSPLAIRAIDQRTGAWPSLIAGHAGAAMLWWWEWVDQTDRWQPYRAIRAFVAGEDLRGREAGCASFVAAATAPVGQSLHAWGWTRPGRILGYVQDPRWGATGGEPQPITAASVIVGAAVPAGEMVLDWWDADAGVVVASEVIDHPGGALALSIPPFGGHIAFKLQRRAEHSDADAPR